MATILPSAPYMVTPTDRHYWDSKHGRMVQFGKIIAALASGTTIDDGVESTLKP